jgi:hypothetical protein
LHPVHRIRAAQRIASQALKKKYENIQTTLDWPAMKSFFLAGHQNMCARYDEKFPFAKHLTTADVIEKLR